MEKRQYTAEYKAKIVLEILAEETSISEIASWEAISRTQLQNRKGIHQKPSASFLSK
ncbi:MAG: hypothetical protein RSC76_02075 [Oscillospiraceae bacterium]